jgi:hypothetical protein
MTVIFTPTHFCVVFRRANPSNNTPAFRPIRDSTPGRSARKSLPVIFSALMKPNLSERAGRGGERGSVAVLISRLYLIFANVTSLTLSGLDPHYLAQRWMGRV